jgi:hypothetical protein
MSQSHSIASGNGKTAALRILSDEPKKGRGNTCDEGEFWNIVGHRI